MILPHDAIPHNDQRRDIESERPHVYPCVWFTGIHPSEMALKPSALKLLNLRDIESERH
jgi:hypothetical protein